MDVSPKRGDTEPARLVVASNSLPRAHARKLVITALEQVGLKQPAAGWELSSLTIGKGVSKKSVSFSDLVSEAERTGIVSSIQDALDHKDEVFGVLFPLETNSPAIAISLGPQGSPFHFGPARIVPKMLTLTEEVLSHRRATCEYSTVNMAKAAMHHRAYIISCSAVVEGFLSAYANVTFEGVPPKGFEDLKAVLPIVKKIELWLQVFAGKTLAAIANTVAWDHFNKIRLLRNKVAHPDQAADVFTLKKVASTLNLVREGVGGFLRKLRELTDESTHSFIERLHRAPLVSVVPRSRAPKA